jgi:hypothetical protein
MLTLQAAILQDCHFDGQCLGPSPTNHMHVFFDKALIIVE